MVPRRIRKYVARVDALRSGNAVPLKHLGENIDDYFEALTLSESSDIIQKRTLRNYDSLRLSMAETGVVPYGSKHLLQAAHRVHTAMSKLKNGADTDCGEFRLRIVRELGRVYRFERASISDALHCLNANIPAIISLWLKFSSTSGHAFVVETRGNGQHDLYSTERTEYGLYERLAARMIAGIRSPLRFYTADMIEILQCFERHKVPNRDVYTRLFGYNPGTLPQRGVLGVECGIAYT